MKWLLRAEEFALFAASVWLFSRTGFAWWWYPALFFIPDIAILGYLAGNRAGAAAYNLTHHKAVALGLAGVGLVAAVPFALMLATVVFGHSSLDRAAGFGLKYPTGFRHTHLGDLPGRLPSE